MKFYLRCSLISLLLLIFFQTSAQEKPSASEWYLNFFSGKSKMPVEDLLQQNAKHLSQANENLDDSARVFLFIERGLIQMTYGFSFDKAADNFIRAMSIADSAEFTEGKLFSYLALSHAFGQVENLKRQEEFIGKAYELTANLLDKEPQLLVLNEAGKVYVKNSQLDKALTSFNEALGYPYLDEIPLLHAELLFNLAVLHERERDYDKTLSVLKQSLAIRRMMLDRYNEGLLLNKIGQVYLLQGNRERALANFKAALEVNQAAKNSEGVADAYNNLGVLYYQEREIKQAIENLTLALEASGTSHSKRTSFEYLSLAFELLGDYKQALKYKNEFISMDALVQGELSERDLAEKKNIYDIQQKETQIDKLESIRLLREQQIADEKQTKNYLIVILALILVLGFLILYQYLQKRRTNKQLQAINARMEAQNIELQNLNSTKDKFFSILGHDLKGPLNSLTSFSNLLINYFDSLSKEEIQTLAKDLDKSIKNLFSLLNNLLEWARSQTGNIDFTPSTFDVVSLLIENKELLTAQASAKQIQLLMEPASGLMAKAHKQSINTIIRNLISNAIKFTPAGGAVKLSANAENHMIKISIADTGVGMSKAVMDKLFRLDAKHSTLGTAQEKGTGLGLILCKDFVEKNGGQIGVRSEEGKGTEFYFTVPAV